MECFQFHTELMVGFLLQVSEFWNRGISNLFGATCQLQKMFIHTLCIVFVQKICPSEQVVIDLQQCYCQILVLHSFVVLFLL